MSTKKTKRALLLLITLFTTSIVYAGEDVTSIQGLAIESPSGLDVDFNEKVEVIARKDRKSGYTGEKIGYWRSTTGVHARMFVGDGLFDIAGTCEYSDYKGLRIGTLPEVDKTYRFNVGGSYHQELTEMWGMFVKGGIEMNKASGGSYTDSLRYYAATGPAVKLRDNFFVLAGIAFRKRLQLSDSVLPYLGLEYHINKDISVRVVQDMITWGGYVDYDIFGDRLIVADLSVEYTDRQYSMAKNPSTGQRMAIRERAWVSALGASWHVDDMFYFRPFVEMLGARKHEMDAHKHGLGSAKVKSGFGFGIQGGARF